MIVGLNACSERERERGIVEDFEMNENFSSRKLEYILISKSFLTKPTAGL